MNEELDEAQLLELITEWEHAMPGQETFDAWQELTSYVRGIRNCETEKNAARWLFMMAVADNPDGPEARAGEALGKEPMETGRPASVQMCELTDAAMTAVKEME